MLVAHTSAISGFTAVPCTFHSTSAGTSSPSLSKLLLRRTMRPWFVPTTTQADSPEPVACSVLQSESMAALINSSEIRSLWKVPSALSHFVEMFHTFPSSSAAPAWPPAPAPFIGKTRSHSAKRRPRSIKTSALQAGALPWSVVPGMSSQATAMSRTAWPSMAAHRGWRWNPVSRKPSPEVSKDAEYNWNSSEIAKCLPDSSVEIPQGWKL
mmetsp:Transcript_113808/g.361717  ORF Transcript_113808/g.361717 Transcript_113808/m.361717 type:complete len:211 (-) Transcript_113808:2306-2938(-)